MGVYHKHIAVLSGEIRRSIRFPRTGATDTWELPCGHWEPNLGPRKEWQVFLTTELSLQAHAGINF